MTTVDGSGALAFDREPLALILAGGSGTRLGVLTAGQPKAAVPFAGQYRTIDFVLSNCVNSQIRRIALLTQYKAQALIRHVQRGWDFLHREVGEFIEIWPAQQLGGERWYEGTVDALHQNRELIEEAAPSHVLVLAGDQIYTLDYSLLLDEHLASGAQATVACVEMAGADSADFQIAELDARGRVVRFDQRARGGRGVCLVAMGVQLFRTEFLLAQLAKCAERSDCGDLERDLLPAAIESGHVAAHVYRKGTEPGYWRDVGTVDRYWAAHMELLGSAPPLELRSAAWPVFTHRPPYGPAEVRPGASVDTAVLSPGCVVAGRVVRSVLSSGCRVEAGAVVRDSVLLPGAEIGPKSIVERAIVDAGCAVPAGTVLGPQTARERGHYVSPRGVLLVTAPVEPSLPYGRRKIA